MDTKPILVTGATGYIGGRLVPQLLAKGYSVRCLARDPNRLRGREWEDYVEIVAGDILDRESLVSAMKGCGTAYYLVHSMASGTGSFRDRDLQGARNFASAASEAQIERILYLGGLGRRSEQLSNHLSSRHEVGDVLRSGSVPTTELRAAMIIGSGSASFEMLRCAGIETAGDDLSEVGFQSHAADRDPERARVSDRLHGEPRDGRSGI